MYMLNVRLERLKDLALATLLYSSSQIPTDKHKQTYGLTTTVCGVDLVLNITNYSLSNGFDFTTPGSTVGKTFPLVSHIHIFPTILA